MLCHQARKRLDELQWSYDNYSRDQQLIEHLKICTECASLVQAEETLRKDLVVVSQTTPPGDLSLETIRMRTEMADTAADGSNKTSDGMIARFLSTLLTVTRPKLAVGIVAAVLAIIALIPFNFREQVGYQIAIDGVEKDIALDNPKITSLLGALGMDANKASTLADSLGENQVKLSVGQCTETCRLTISDLKTERDVRLMVKAIVELGCCRIDDIVPIFRSESTSLLRLAAKKLLS